MPLPSRVRATFSSIPELDDNETPPKIAYESENIDTELSYSQIQFDPNKDRIDGGNNTEVYKATVRPSGTTIALKQPLQKTTTPKEKVAQILEEGEKWAKIDQHPYVANVHDWGLGAVPWIAIEYVDGGVVTDSIGEMSLEQRLWTAYAIVDAIAYANGQKSILHHDLKPQNILLQSSPNGVWDVPKVVDWGLSRELIKHTGSVSEVSSKYAAPEQFDTELPDVPVGPHTDVYQLGVICYEITTGNYPRHHNGDVAAPSEVVSDIPSGIDAPILQAIERERDNRLDHAIVLREKLKSVIQEFLTQGVKDATPPSPRSQNGANTGLQKNNNKLETHKSKSINVKIFGCGGAGCSVIDEITGNKFDNVDIVAAHTDVQDLVGTSADTKILLGKEKTEGHGSGSLPQVGEEAALEAKDEITEAIGNAELVFIVAGLGGGTGTGATPVISKIARENGALNIPIVTTPFTAEGEVRRTNAEAGLKRLDDVADTTVVLQNDRFIDKKEKVKIQTAFNLVNNTIIKFIRSIYTLINTHGNVNMTFSDVRTVLERGGYATVGIGEVDTKNITEVTRSAINDPLFEADKSSYIDSVLIGLFSDKNTPRNMGSVLDTLDEQVSPTGRTIYGTATDEGLEADVRALIVATGIDKFPELEDSRSVNTESTEFDRI